MWVYCLVSFKLTSHGFCHNIFFTCSSLGVLRMKSYKLYALICVELHMLVLFFANLRIFMDECERKMNFWCSQVLDRSCTYLQAVHRSVWWLAAHCNTCVLQVSILMIYSYQLSYLCWLFFRKICWLVSFADLKNWCGERNSPNAESTTCASCWPSWLVSLKVKEEESLGHLTSHTGGASRAFSYSFTKKREKDLNMLLLRFYIYIHKAHCVLGK